MCSLEKELTRLSSSVLAANERCWAAQDDLVCMPQKAAAALGGFGPLALCTRVSNALTLTDPATLRSVLLDVRPCACTRRLQPLH